MRLININRSEPDPALFQPPPDYKIEDGPTGPVVFKAAPLPPPQAR